MTPLTDNPFAVLTTIVAPAVLTNACSVLCLGTSNRIARVVDQSRAVAAELKALTPYSVETPQWEGQFRALRGRARRLFWALRLFYASLGAFAAAALVAVAGSALAAHDFGQLFRAVAGFGLAVGALGVGALAAGCALMVSEVRLALKQTADEADRVLAMSSRPTPAGPSPLPPAVPALAD